MLDAKRKKMLEKNQKLWVLKRKEKMLVAPDDVFMFSSNIIDVRN